MNNLFLDQVLAAQVKWQEVSGDDASIEKMAIESLTKCSDAVRVLSDNLRGMGYNFVVSTQLPADVIERNVTKIEKAIDAPVPRILVLFWQIVGGIAFVDLDNYQHVEFWKDQKLISPKYYCDGLYIDLCSDEWSAFICSDFLDWQDYRDSEDSGQFLLTLSPDGYHKDNISGGAPYGIYTDSAWKPVWQNFEWSGIAHPRTALVDRPDFLSYIRTTLLECAGFPAFLGLPGFHLIKERLLQRVPVF